MLFPGGEIKFTLSAYTPQYYKVLLLDIQIQSMFRAKITQIKCIELCNQMAKTRKYIQRLQKTSDEP